MEDAHISRFNFSDQVEDANIFGVFDGHGGVIILNFNRFTGYLR